MKNTSKVTSEQVPMWTKRSAEYRDHCDVRKLERKKRNFDSVSKDIKSKPKSDKYKPKQTEVTHRQQSNESKYCGS